MPKYAGIENSIPIISNKDGDSILTIMAKDRMTKLIDVVL